MSNDQGRKEAGAKRDLINSADSKNTYINAQRINERFLQLQQEDNYKLKGKSSGHGPSNDVVTRSLMNKEELVPAKSAARPAARVRKEFNPLAQDGT